MKVVILAGGLGTRLAEETDIIPKPMVEIGEHPILWHIMKHYARFGFREFVIALGYKGHLIKSYFSDYYRRAGNLRIDLIAGSVEVDSVHDEDWVVHLIDTGLETQTGGRIKRLEGLLKKERFLLTYGDGLSNVPINELVAFHDRSGGLATITAVHPPARFGSMDIDGERVSTFLEKPQTGEGWINGGFMVLEPGVLEYLSGDATSFEYDALTRMAEDGVLAAYRHENFWMCMDTLRDKWLLQRLWQRGAPPWKTWS